MEKTNIFKCKPAEVHFTIRDRVPYNKLLTNLACSSRTGEYWPSRSVSKRLLFSSFPRLALRARVALRAKYRVRPAWLIKRQSCRLILEQNTPRPDEGVVLVLHSLLKIELIYSQLVSFCRANDHNFSNRPTVKASRRLDFDISYSIVRSRVPRTALLT